MLLLGGNNKMKIAISIILMFQAVLMIMGFYQISNQSALIQGCGYFNIIVNSIFGVFNVKKIFS